MTAQSIFKIATWNYPRFCCRSKPYRETNKEKILDQLFLQIFKGNLLIVEKNPRVSSKSTQFFQYLTGNWNQDTTVNAQLGQKVRIKVKNINCLGTTIEVEVRAIHRTKQSILVPYKETIFEFSRFGSEPQPWDFKVRTKSDVFLVNYKIESTWIPGMELNK